MEEIFELNRVVGSYRVIRVLGSGGMGVVYEAEHLELKVRRALKVFAVGGEHAALHRKRFLSEGKMLAALDHARVVRVHEFDVDAVSGRPYFVMDLVLSPDGRPRTLEDERIAGVEESRAAALFRDLCEGLDYVHAAGIVHRDVKLENVLIGPDGHAVLSDFGISRIFDDDLRRRLDITVTMPQDDQTVRCLGSAYYLAPEQLGTTPEKASPATDAWSLGVTMFRFLTGFWFERANRQKCLDVLADYALPWQSLIDRLCAERPEARLDEGGFRALAVGWPDASRPRRRGVLLGAVCLGGLVAVAALLLLCRTNPVSAPAPDEEVVASASAEGPAVEPEETDGETDADEPEEPAESGIRLPPLAIDAPTLSEYYREHFDAADRRLLAGGRCLEDPTLRNALLSNVQAGRAHVRHYGLLDQEQCDFIDRFVDGWLAGDGDCRASADVYQIFVLAGESFRARMCLTPYRDNAADLKRMTDVMKEFLIACYEEMRRAEPDGRTDITPEWMYLKMRLTKTSEWREIYEAVLSDPHLTSLADVWLMYMWHGDVERYEADRIRRGRLWDMMTDEDAEACRRGEAAARKWYAEADRMSQGESYYAALMMMAVEQGDVRSVCRWFTRAQSACCDDPWIWTHYIKALTTRWGGSRELVLQALDQALASGRYDSWLPAVYVTQRWLVYAAMEGEYGPYDADSRAWAFEEESVRTNVLRLIDRYVAGDCFKNAPDWLRTWHTALFAVVALDCQDEALAERMIKKIPDRWTRSIFLYTIARRARIVSRLEELFKRPQEEKQDMEERHANL